MSNTVRIPLAEPIDGHKGRITEIVLREPTYDEYISCGGEPYSIGQTPEGNLFQIEKDDVIWAYADVLMVEPNEKLLLGKKANWRAAREVRKAILGFFQGRAEGSEPSETSPTTSPSS